MLPSRHRALQFIGSGQTHAKSIHARFGIPTGGIVRPIPSSHPSSLSAPDAGRWGTIFQLNPVTLSFLPSLCAISTQSYKALASRPDRYLRSTYFNVQCLPPHFILFCFALVPSGKVSSRFTSEQWTLLSKAEHV